MPLKSKESCPCGDGPCTSCTAVPTRVTVWHGVSQAEGYDPRRSNVKEDALADFIRAPITGDLTEVSGPVQIEPWPHAPHTPGGVVVHEAAGEVMTSLEFACQHAVEASSRKVEEA